MAIYTGGMRMKQEASAAAKKIAEQQAQAEAGEAKRKGRAGLWGKIGGMALGAAAVGLTGLTGGLAAPLVMGIASSLGKKWADEASKGSSVLGKIGLGKMLKSPGQVGKIEAGKYGYGRGEAATATKALQESRKTDFSAGTMLGDIATSYVTAGLSGGLGGAAKGLAKGDLSLGQALTTGSEEAWKFGGIQGAKEGVLGLIPGYESAGKAVDPSTIDLEASLEGSGLSLEQYNRMKDTAQANYMDDADDWFGGGDAVVEPFDFNQPDPIYNMAQGGQVPQLDQHTLIGLGLLSQMQQQQETAYSGTPLEEEKQQSTISEMFASQGKTLGGNNTQSLSQILGR